MIRLANLQDASAIATVHVRSWQEEHFDDFLPDLPHADSTNAQASPWAKIIKQRPGDVAVFELPSGIAGFTSICPSQDDDATPGTGELTGIYLDPAFWKKGIGTLLMDWAKASARARHWHKMTLWVLSDNTQARAFYQASGWQADGGTKIEAFAGEEIVEVRYVWICEV